MTYKEISLLIKLCIVLGIFIILASNSTQAGEYRITTLNTSKHYSDDEEYNENHRGLGIEYEVKEDLWLGVTSFTNSFDKPSILLSFNKEYLIAPGFYFGIIGGAATGYDPYVALTGVTIRYKVVRVFILPTVTAVGFVWQF